MAFSKALRLNFDNLVQYLSSDDIRGKLVQEDVLTYQQNEEISANNKGESNKSEQMLNIILSKNDEYRNKTFVTVLLNSQKSSNHELGKRILETVSKIQNGEIGADITGVRSYLRKRYTCPEWTTEVPVPHDKFYFDVSNEKLNLYYTCKAEVRDEAQYKNDLELLKEGDIKAEYVPIPITRIEEVLKSSLMPRHATRKSCPNLLSLGEVKKDKRRHASFSHFPHSLESDKEPSKIHQTVKIHIGPPNTPENALTHPWLVDPSSEIERNQTDTFADNHRPECVSSTKINFENVPPNIVVTNELSDHRTGIKTRLIQCAGDAGMGKSTLVKRLSYKWAKEKCESMEHFQLIFTINLKMVKYNKAIVDILEECKQLSADNKEIFMEYMSNPNSGSTVLFMIDGCDEVNLSKGSEIWQLIEGRLYPGVTVFATVRPDTDVYEDLCKLNPMVKVKMTGTEESSMINYIKEILKGQDSDSHQNSCIQNIIHQCEKYQFDYNILSKPLYLTMFCLMVHEKYAKLAKFTKMNIPESNTDLFNAFMELTLRREMERCGNKYGIKDKKREPIQFGKTPLDTRSTIPLQVQHNIYFVAKMSFEALLVNKYDFTTDDLKKYKLSTDIITSMGIFCTDEKEDKKIAYIRHKLIQEYMAALYIADEGFKLKSLCDMIENAAKSTGEARLSISQIFSKIPNPIQMACGLSTEFYLDLLERVQPIASVIKKDYHMCNMQVQYEFSLCYEAGYKQRNVLKKMEDYLKSVPVNDVANSTSQACSPYHMRCITAVIKHFSKSAVQELLKKWYDINSETGGTTSMQARLISSPCYMGNSPVQKGSFYLPNGIGIICLALLSQFTFHDVTSLTIRGNCGVIDLDQLLVIFPRLTEMETKMKFCNESLPDKGLKDRICDGKFSQSLEKFVLRGSTHMLFPVPSTECLFKQTHLKTLKLYGIDILSNMPKISSTFANHWCNLDTLKMVWCNIDRERTKYLVQILSNTPELTNLNISENSTIDMNNLCLILPQLRKLQTLNLAGAGLNKENMDGLCNALMKTPTIAHLNLSDNNGMDVVKISHCIEHLTNLQVLYLFRSLEQNGTAGLAETLPKLTKLEVIGLYSTDIQGKESTIVEALLKCANMKKVEVEELEWGYHSTFNGELKKRLSGNHIEIFELSAQG